MGKALIVFVIVVLVILGYLSYRENRQECERLGGLFYSSAFGADNCVFPPQQPTNNELIKGESE